MSGGNSVKLSKFMVQDLYNLSQEEDEDLNITVLVAVHGYRTRTLKALQKRGLIEAYMLDHPANAVFRGSEPWREPKIRVTQAGLDELKQWSFDEAEAA